MSRFALCTAAVIVCVPLMARAQPGSFSGTAVGVTVQAIGTEEGISDMPAVALHVTATGRSRIGIDITVATLPTFVLATGVLLVVPDMGLAGVIPIGGGALMIKGGPSAVILGGPDGGVLWGAHIGAAAFVRLSNRFGIRAEIVPHLYDYGEGPRQLTTFGLGFTSLPRRSR